MKKLNKVSLALILALSLILTACTKQASQTSQAATSSSKARTIKQIKKSGELRIAVFSDKNHLAMLIIKEIIKDMTFTLAINWQKI